MVFVSWFPNREEGGTGGPPYAAGHMGGTGGGFALPAGGLRAGVPGRTPARPHLFTEGK
ncbi:hypothetical protein [Streptomyces brevispora]|uniref:Uncharacterized protein n=1 Tax=Streptomyces brevispora TaxID=887462 RepID=A0A561TYG6_9ACTN|nr:hypothetical protein [Streptomyces brevispora]TWF92144.1 hypothetical protein FHX80_12463 [Streptomyces brevispora]WSC11551.1 hypothetical protein OIE64_00770 [Streptomyces brevispora]WSC17560.1 hypothetical protein OIE64_35270 [Streptomyces brevispora]